MEEQDLPLNTGGPDLPGVQPGAMNVGSQTQDVNTETQAEYKQPSDITKVPVTLESLSGKIDQILEYLATNKSELSTINKRHEKRFKILEGAYNDVADRFDQISSDVSDNATEIARNSTNIESSEACISTLKTQLRLCKSTNEEYLSNLKDMDLEMKNNKSEFAELKRVALDFGLEVRERRLALSGVIEKDDEDLITVALNAVNKIMTHAVNQSKAPAKQTGARPKLRTLKLADIDNV